MTDRTSIPTVPTPVVLEDRVFDGILERVTPIGPIVTDFRPSVGGLRSDTLAAQPLGGLVEVLTAAAVDQPVAVISGQRPPRYPLGLERAAIAGDVIAQFIVDTTGRVERASIVVQQATHADFARAVQERLVALHFVPARARGRLVRQLVEQRFHFEVVRR